MNSALEVWRNIDGYDGLYQVSNKGRIRSFHRWRGETPDENGRILRQSKTTTGYLKVELRKDGRKKTKKVHRLVAAAFIPNPDNLPMINHKDVNPLNNNVENLEWCDQNYNMRYAYEHGNKKRKYDKDTIREMYLGGLSTNEIAQIIGANRASVRYHLKRQNVKMREMWETRKYKIPREKMIDLIEEGFGNTEIANILGCTENLVARRRYQHKKGEI